MTERKGRQKMGEVKKKGKRTWFSPSVVGYPVPLGTM
jgi:hypothetical protein